MPVCLYICPHTHRHTTYRYCCSVYQHWDAWHYSRSDMCEKSFWSRDSNLQEDCRGPTDRSCGIHSSTTTSQLFARQGQLSICITKYPLMLRLGGLYPQLTPGPHLTTGNASTAFCSRKQQHQSVPATFD